MYFILCDIIFQISATNERNFFSFGTHKEPGLGTVDIRVPIYPCYFLHLTIDVVDTNVPFLLGLVNTEKYRMVLDAEKCITSSRLQVWTIPLRRKMGHLYYE